MQESMEGPARSRQNQSIIDDQDLEESASQFQTPKQGRSRTLVSQSRKFNLGHFRNQLIINNTNLHSKTPSFSGNLQQPRSSQKFQTLVTKRAKDNFIEAFDVSKSYQDGKSLMKRSSAGPLNRGSSEYESYSTLTSKNIGKDLRASLEEKLMSRGGFKKLLEGDNLKVNLLTTTKHQPFQEPLNHLLTRNNKGINQSSPYKYQSVNDEYQNAKGQSRPSTSHTMMPTDRMTKASQRSMNPLNTTFAASSLPSKSHSKLILQKTYR